MGITQLDIAVTTEKAKIRMTFTQYKNERPFILTTH